MGWELSFEMLLMIFLYTNVFSFPKIGRDVKFESFVVLDEVLHDAPVHPRVEPVHLQQSPLAPAKTGLGRLENH